MVRRLLPVALLVVVVAGVIAPSTAAKESGTMGASAGVTVSGSPYRYVAIAPGRSDRLTVVERIDRKGGRVSRWWYLPGGYYVPAVAYDGSPGGLSADGTTLVLTRFPDPYLRVKTTRLAILDTNLYLRHPRRGGQRRPRHAFTRVNLHGSFSFDAISPDGSTVFLTHYLEPARAGAHLGASEIRALDTATGRLLRTPVLATEEPKGEEKSRLGEALPITRANSTDGRWAYTLYGGNGQVPFIEALDTVRQYPISFKKLPQLSNQHNPFLLKLQMEDGGHRIGVLARSPIQGGRTRPLLSVDAKTFEARKVTPVAPTNRKAAGRFLAFTQTPRFPGNLLGRAGVAGHSVDGRPILLHQIGDPSIENSVLVFGCIHGDECAADRIEPLGKAGCPDPRANILLVHNLNPDGTALGTRLNGRGVDLNRNFPSGWEPIGSRGDPQYSGPRPFSEPETRLAARIVRRLRPEVTIWFHQRYGLRSLVRAWGQSVPAARRFARFTRLPFHRVPWPAGTAPNWQNHRFPGASSFVVEFARGPLPDTVVSRLSRAVDRLGREVGEDGLSRKR
jgi:protein MpaA